MKVANKQSLKPLYLQIREKLLREARKDKNYRFPSERKLCQIYDISRPTIRKALDYFVENNLIVRRPGKGTMLCENAKLSTEAIEAVKIVIRSDWKKWRDDTYFGQILTGVVGGMDSTDCQVTIQKYSEKLQLQLLASPHICSMWLSPENTEILAMKDLADAGHHVIALNRAINYSAISYVSTNHQGGSQQATEYLLNNGHQKILYIGSEQGTSLDSKRYKGFISQFRKADKDSLPSPLNLQGVDYEKELKKLLPGLLTSSECPTALFLSNGHFQAPVVKILNKLKLKISDDISIISFDDIEDISEKHGITVIKQPLKELASKAFELIFKKNTQTEKVLLTPYIVKRNSVKNITQK